MKVIILGVLISLLLAGTGWSQTTIRLDGPGRVIPSDQQPLIIVDSIVTDFNHLLINPDKIQSIDVLKDSAVTRVYGEKARYGVVIIRTKEKGAVLSLDELLDEFHISREDRKLRVCIDHILAKDTKKILADRTNVARVEVITDTCWISPVEAGPEERYINIVTKKAVRPAP